MEFREIGSNFYTNNFQLADQVNENILREKYITKSIEYLSLGRNAISLILDGLKLNNKVVLLPGFTCETVVKPFISKNFKVVYYNFHKDLTINLKDLNTKIKKHNPGIILVHGFFGYNTFLTAKSLLQTARNSGSLIIEDDTQTIFSNIEILSADYYLGSLRKWMEIPDGAFFCTSEPTTLKSYSENTTYISLLEKAFKLKFDYVISLNENLKLRYKKLYLEAQNLADNCILIFKMSELSKGILNNCDIKSMKNQRIENFNYLQTHIQNEFKSIKTVFQTPADHNICPFYFPLFVDERIEFQQILSENDIYATIIWPKYEHIKELDDETEFIYNKIIGIPCDQRYHEKDMVRIFDLLKKYFF